MDWQTIEVKRDKDEKRQRGVSRCACGEYARSELDVLSNFNRVGATVQISGPNGNPLPIGAAACCCVYLLKHIDGILAYVSGNKRQRDSIQGRIDDAVNYLHLLSAILEEESSASLPQTAADEILRPFASPAPEALQTDSPQ